MSYELLMAAVASENLPWEGLHERQPDGSIKTLGEVYYPEGRRNAARYVTSVEAMTEHPDAYWNVRVQPSQMWRPPSPPDGADVHRDPKARRRYRETLRASLQDFINAQLVELNFMFSTGAFVLGVARVKVVEFRPVPKRVMRAFARKIGKVKRTGKPLAIPPGAGQVMIPRDTAPARKPKRRAKAAKGRR